MSELRIILKYRPDEKKKSLLLLVRSYRNLENHQEKVRRYR